MAEEEQKKRGNLANLKPFKKLEECTEEEKAYFEDVRQKGGKARQEQLRQRRSMQEVTREMLYTSISRSQAEEILGTSANLISDEDLTLMSVLSMRIIQESAQGNCRAYELIRDTAGFSPKQELSIEADVTTEADRELMQNVLKRLG